MTKEFQPNNLTREAQNPYPENGDKYMPEPGQGENQPPIKPSVTPEARSGSKNVDINELTGDSRRFPKEVLEKATIELVLKQDLAPEDRIKEAERVLSRSLTAEERNALLEAHNVGRGEAGKNGGEAGIGNYTREQLAEKARILKEEGFKKAERRTLMEKGLVGIDATGISDPELVAEINDHNRKESFNSLSVESNLQTINNLEKRASLPGFPPTERARVREIVEQLIVETQDIAEREAERQRDFVRSRLNRNNPENFFDEDQLVAIADRANPEKAEEIFNSLFVRADAQPNREFSEAFNQLTDQPIYTAFIDALHNAGRTEDANRFVNEFAMRQIIHNAGYVFYSGIDAEKLSGFLQPFRADLADLAFSKKGVVDTAHFYELALLKVREENSGYIPAIEADGDVLTGQKGRVEQLTRQYLREAIRKGQVAGTERYDEQGNIIVDEQGRPTYGMEDWEENRAVAFAKGMGIIVGRVPEIAASSILPELPTEGERGAREMTGGRFASLWGQDVIKGIAPFRHSIFKFDIGGASNRVFSYITNRERRPWEYKELEEWVWDKQVDIINNVSDDKRGTRYLQRLNPFRIGGIFSRTTWRYSNDPTASALGDMGEADMGWIGTGMQIEKARGDLSGHDATKSAAAEVIIRRGLDKISNILPLRLFYNLRDVQEAALNGVGRNMKDLLLIGDRNNLDVMGDLDRLAIVQDKAIKDRAEALNFDEIEDPVQRARIINLVNAIKNAFTEGEPDKTRLDQFVENLKHNEWEVPFIFGTDDLPYDKYNFAKTGATSIARRWRDIASAKTASDATHKLVEGMAHFKSPEQIVEVLAEVYKGVAGYDAHIAEAVVADYAEGIMKFYGKDWYNRLPLGIGTLTDKLLGRASFAQASFGRGAMAWNELQLNDFTVLLRDSHLISHEIQQDLQKRAGGGKKEVAWGLVRTIAPLLMVAFIYYMMSKVAKEK